MVVNINIYAMSKLRGYEIEEKDGEFFYKDNGNSTAETWKERPCGHCGKHNTDKDHDACLVELPGVLNACCGHGSRDESYIQFENGVIVRGFVLSDR
jgi:hypothetical protein